MSTGAIGDSPNAVHACPHCRAAWRVGAKRCWLCHADVEQESMLPPVASPSMPAERTGSYSPASLMMFVTLVCVVLGVSTLWPGVGIPLGLLLLLVWLRTAAVTRRRAGRGLAVTAVEQTQLFASSFGVTAALLGLVGVAGFSAFWAAFYACAGTYFGLKGAYGDDFAATMGWTAFGVVLLAISVVTLWYALPFVIRIIRLRWRRDIGEPQGTAGEEKSLSSIQRRLIVIVICIVAITALLWFLLEPMGGTNVF